MERGYCWFRRGTPALGIVLLAITAQSADVPPPPKGREKVSVTFTLLATPRQAATFPIASMGPIDLAIGEAMVRSGTVEPFAFGGNPDDCSAGLSIEPVEAMLERYPIAWAADVRLDEVTTNRLVLSGTWERYTRGADGKAVRAAGARFASIALREEERVLLDLATPSPDGSECMRNFALELTAKVKEDPALAPRQIGYELWLVHEADGGTTTAGRARLTAGHGQEASFAFPRVTLPAADGGAAKGTLNVTVTGRVRGRVRTDGTVVLSLATLRALSYVAPDGASDGGISEGGEKAVDVRPDETVRLDVPDPARGAAKDDPRASRMAHDLAGHSFAIVFRAKPLS